MNRGTCIHFNGLPVGYDYKSKCCAAGVNYFETFDGRKGGIMLRMPCVHAREKHANGRPGTFFNPNDGTVVVPVDRRGQEVIPCAVFLQPTDEQIEQERKEMAAAWRKTIAAIDVAAKWRVKPKPPEDRYEVVECPVCKGNLHLSQSAFNGHVHGQCETEGCVSWMM